MGGYSRGGGPYTREACKIIVYMKKTLIKDLVYFRRNFFINIKMVITKSTNRGGNSRICGSSGGSFEEGPIENF